MTRADVEPRDEGHHEHGDEPSWSERLSFSFFDAASGMGGIARVEARPREGADGALNLFLPGRGIATVLAKGPRIGAGWNVARLALEVEDPLVRWRLRCKDVALIVTDGGGGRRGAAAPIEVDLVFEAWMRPSGSVERRTEVDDQSFATVVSSGHFEQAGKITGTIRVGPRAVEVDGAGVRDKSWGSRDGTATHESRWFAIPFARELAIGARAVTLGERAMRSGWVLRDGAVRRLGTLRARAEYEGKRIARVSLEIADADGERYDVEGETVATMQTREGRALVTRALVRWRMGARETLGLAEYTDG